MTDQTRPANTMTHVPEPEVWSKGAGFTGMEYKILGSTLQSVILELDPGETVYSESGGMAWMSANIEMKTTTRGGMGGLVKRAFTGESLFLVEYTSTGGKGTVAFASDFPGKILPLHLEAGQQIIAQKTAFLCAEKSVKLDIHFRKKIMAGLFGGEGFIMQKLTGPGVAFVCLDGEIIEYDLAEGQSLKVDIGHIALLEPSVQFDVQMVKGITNILFAGEGLFLATLKGPGRVWLQTMPVSNLAGLIGGMIYKPK